MRLNHIELLKGTVLELSPITVIVGPNAVGKSTFVRELYRYSINPDYPGKRWWISSTEMFEADSSDAAARLLGTLVEIGTSGDAQHKKYYSSSLKTEAGTVDEQIVQQHLVDQLNGVIDGTHSGDSLTTNPVFRRFFFAFHSCDSRLNVPDQSAIQGISERPNDVINVLFRDPALFKTFQSEIERIFKVKLAILNHDPPRLELGLVASEMPEKNDIAPPEYFRLVEDWKEGNFIPLGQAGHGIRAFANLILGLVDPVNDIVLIDEPELFLYPSAKARLGRDLARFSQLSSNGAGAKQLIIVTHDATLLQGVLDVGEEVEVVRLDFDVENTERQLKSAQLGTIHETVGSRRNQREYLNAMFSSRPILVEGAVDRAFYSAVIADMDEFSGLDVGFVVGSGKGGILNVGRICLQFGIPFRAIYDFDVLIYDSHNLLELAALSGLTIDKRALEKLADDAKRLVTTRQLKRRGLRADGLSEEVRRRFRRYIRRLRQIGVHIVPIGEVESWVSGAQGARFAEDAIKIIAEDPRAGREVRRFCRRVLK